MAPASSSSPSSLPRRALGLALGAAVAAGSALVWAPGTANASPASPSRAAAIVTPARTIVPGARTGWSVASVGTESSPTTMYLIAPAGARYRLGTLAAGWRVVAVSNQGRRLLLTDDLGAHYAVYDDVAHTTTRVASTMTNGYFTPLRFTNPQGLSLLGGRMMGKMSVQVEKTTLSGVQIRRYTALDITSLVAMPQTANGTLVLGSRNSRVAVLNNATGSVVRQLPDPHGFVQCQPTGMWDATHILGVCTDSNDGRSSVFTWPLTGGTATARAIANTTRSAQITFASARPTTIGPVALATTTIPATDQVLTQLGVVAPDTRRFTALSVPANWTPVDVFTASALYLSNATRRVAYSYNFTTHRLTTLAGGTSDSAGVTSLVPVDARN